MTNEQIENYMESIPGTRITNPHYLNIMDLLHVMKNKNYQIEFLKKQLKDCRPTRGQIQDAALSEMPVWVNGEADTILGTFKITKNDYTGKWFCSLQNQWMSRQWEDDFEAGCEAEIFYREQITKLFNNF